MIIAAPLKGNIHPLSKAQDEAFASGALGQGAMIEPNEEVVVAPFDGTVTALFPTKHAIGLTSKDGIELLIHVGINTVELNGKHFKTFVNQGDSVKKGQKLIEFDKDSISKEGYLTQTMIIVTNSADFKQIDVVDEVLNA